MMKSIIASLFAIYSVTSGLVTLPTQAHTGPQNFDCIRSYMMEDPVTGEMVPDMQSCAQKCALPNPHAADQGAASSKKTPIIIESPAQMFEWKAGALGAAAQCDLHFNYGPGGMTKNLNLVECSEAYSCYGTKLFFNSQQTGVHLQVNEIKCSTAGACDNMEIWLDNCDLADMSCAYPHYCSNCKIFEVGSTGPPKPCFGW